MARTKLKRILALLLDPNYVSSSKYELAKKTNSSPSWALKLMKKLEEKGLVKGLKVIDVKKTFEFFHSIRPKKQIARSYAIYSIGDTSKLVEIFKKSNKEYAFTTYVAENMLQKYLFSKRSEAYVRQEDIDKWHEELTKLGAYGGGNVKIIVSTHDELFNKKQISEEGPWLVNMPQLISDLHVEGGPAKEAGEMLLEKLVKAIEEKNNAITLSKK